MGQPHGDVSGERSRLPRSILLPQAIEEDTWTAPETGSKQPAKKKLLTGVSVATQVRRLYRAYCGPLLSIIFLTSVAMHSHSRKLISVTSKFHTCTKVMCRVQLCACRHTCFATTCSQVFCVFCGRPPLSFTPSLVTMVAMPDR